MLSGQEKFLYKIVLIWGAIKKHNPRDFYKSVSPFLSDKPSSSNGKVILCDDGNIVSDSTQVANIFNMHYSSISEYDGTPDGLDCLTFEDAVLKHASHESISLINQHTAPRETFRFKLVSYETFKCYIDQLKSNKAVGFDGLQANSWNCPGINILVPCVIVLISAFVLMFLSFHVWNLLK